MISTLFKEPLNYLEIGMDDLRVEFKAQESYKLFINNDWVDSVSGKTVGSINPATSELFTTVALGDSKDVDLAVQSAKTALETWRLTSPIERQDALLKIADLLEAEKDKFAYLEAAETGKPIRETSHIDVPLAIDHFRYFAGVIRSHSDEADMLNEETMSLVLSEPIGVVGQVIPWNYPLLMAAPC